MTENLSQKETGWYWIWLRSAWKMAYFNGRDVRAAGALYSPGALKGAVGPLQPPPPKDDKPYFAPLLREYLQTPRTLPQVTRWLGSRQEPTLNRLRELVNAGFVIEIPGNAIDRPKYRTAASEETD